MTREEAIVAGMEVCEIQGRKGASTGRKGARNLRALAYCNY